MGRSGPLLLFADAFERSAVLFDIHKLSGCRVSFDIPVGFGIQHLASTFYGTFPMSVAIRFVCRHHAMSFSPNETAGFTLSVPRSGQHSTKQHFVYQSAPHAYAETGVEGWDCRSAYQVKNARTDWGCKDRIRTGLLFGRMAAGTKKRRYGLLKELGLPPIGDDFICMAGMQVHDSPKKKTALQ